MNRAEELKVRNEKIKAQYHASLLSSMTNAFVVETKGLYCWSPNKWSFPTLEDAKAYAEKEVKGQARVTKNTMVDAHTMNVEIVWTKEV